MVALVLAWEMIAQRRLLAPCLCYNYSCSHCFNLCIIAKHKYFSHTLVRYFLICINYLTSDSFVHINIADLAGLCKNIFISIFYLCMCTWLISSLFIHSDPRLLRSKYDDIVQSLPSNYEKTLQVVQDHLTDDQICDVLATPNYTIANKTILNCLMEKVKCEGDVLEFCNQLENISSLLPDHGSLFSIISELRTGLNTVYVYACVTILCRMSSVHLV